MFEIIIVGNPATRRTEAEIADASGNRVAIVYEDVSGWHTEILEYGVKESPSKLSAPIENAKEVLSHYVNRRGDNVPEDLTTVGALSLWLLKKAGGIAKPDKR
jgi:hypothetical protein